MSTQLEALGIELRQGFSPEHLADQPELIVVGNAVSRSNPEVQAMLERGIPFLSFPQALAEFFLPDRHPIVVVGTHGKTTTAALMAWVLETAGLDPSYMIGGIPRNFEANYKLGNGAFFVIEGDEYDSAFFDKTAKFLKYLPDIAVVGNIEYDHADIYPDLDAIRLTFQRFVNLIPRRGLLLVGADNADALAMKARARCRVETFGLANGADWQAHDLRVGTTSTTFSVRKQGDPIGTFEVPLLGAYNVRNALAALAVGAAVGLNTDTMAEGLRTFRGVRRRLEHRGTASGVAVYDDFAHHPTAIAETLAGVRSAHPDRRIWAIFEPRSATSCRRVFQEDFVRALSTADRVILPAVFRSTLPEDERLSAEQVIESLKQEGVDARYIPRVDDIVATVARDAAPGDLVIVMSNGGFDDIHRKLTSALEDRGAHEAR